MISFDRLGLSNLDVPEAVDCILAKKVGNVRLMDAVCGENSSSNVSMALLHCSPGINVVSSNPSKFIHNYPDHPYQVPGVERDKDGLVGEISSYVGCKDNNGG